MNTYLITVEEKSCRYITYKVLADSKGKAIRLVKNHDESIEELMDDYGDGTEETIIEVNNYGPIIYNFQSDIHEGYEVE